MVSFVELGMILVVVIGLMVQRLVMVVMMPSEARPDFLGHRSVDASGMLDAVQQFLQLEASVLQPLQGVPEVVEVGHHPVQRVLRTERREHLGQLLPSCVRRAEALLALAGIGKVRLAAHSAHHVGTHVRAFAHQAAVLALAVLAVRLAHGDHALDGRVNRVHLSELRAVHVGRGVVGMPETVLVSVVIEPSVLPSASGSSVLVALSAVGLVTFF